MTLISSSHPFSESHHIWLCDIWGVVHNGLARFDGAVEALMRHRKMGGTVILISNSPRPKPQLIEQLEHLYVSVDAYDDIISSGDVTRSLVKTRISETVFHLGPDRDKGIFEGLECRFSDAFEADYIVCSGLLDDTSETPDDYAELLAQCAEAKLEMVCANPDLKVQRGDSIVYCAGALAKAYEALGAKVIYAGKPYLPIYELALEQASKARGALVNRGQVLAIGDGIHTDVAGAAQFGCDFLFITGGLHQAENGQEDVFGESAAQDIARSLTAEEPALKLKGVSQFLA